MALKSSSYNRWTSVAFTNWRGSAITIRTDGPPTLECGKRERQRIDSSVSIPFDRVQLRFPPTSVLMGIYLCGAESINFDWYVSGHPR